MIYLWCIVKIFLINPLWWLFKHKIALVGLVGLVGAGFAYQSCNRTEENPVAPQQVELTKEERLAPTVKEAPDVLQTLSRVYYVAKYTKVSEDRVILYSWFEWTGRKWIPQYSAQGVTFDKQTTGDFRLVKR